MSLKQNGTSKDEILIFSLLFMGLAHILYFKQYIKGAFFAVIEIALLVNLPMIIRTVRNLVALGEHKPELPAMMRDHSTFMLIEGVAILAVLALFACIYYISVKSAAKTYADFCVTGKLTKNRDSVKELVNQAFPIFGLAVPILLVVFFVLVPLVFAALVSFTNYSSPFNIPPGNTVDWVGLDNYISLFSGETLWTGALIRVAVWTVTWAFLATTTCYFGGMIMAVILKEFKIKFGGVFRTIFILPYAVPAVISMLVWRNLLHGLGPINNTLLHFGIIDSGIPWLTSVGMVRFMIILINLWAGFPYFMLLTMGSMTAINDEMFEAAKVDGANKFQLFRHITFPMVTFQTMPLIIMSFTHNINNFGAIFFLTGGSPPPVRDTPLTSATGADILITWIYRLTMDTRQYSFAAVLAVLIFVILAPFAIFQFMRTKSFKDGEL
jgi:arabinogalactan oligomer/maltooligosaccharide transport system permease protein